MRNVPERIITVANPAGTRKHIAYRATDRLREVFGNRVVEQPTLPCAKDTTDVLRSVVREGDVVATLGGDGTARTAVEALADPSLPAHGAYLLPLPYGFQNDLSRQLYGRERSSDPVRIIYDSRTIDLMPLRVGIEHETTEEYLSALYVSVGLIAHAAAFLESAEFRDHWMYHNAMLRDAYSLRVLPWALGNLDPLDATINGERREVVDITVAKVASLARYLHPPVELVADEACYLEIQRGSLREIGAYVARLMAQPYVSAPAHRIMTNESAPSSITVHNDTHVHTDGDARPILAGTTVTIGLHDTPYHAYTTKNW